MRGAQASTAGLVPPLQASGWDLGNEAEEKGGTYE